MLSRDIALMAAFGIIIVLMLVLFQQPNQATAQQATAVTCREGFVAVRIPIQTKVMGQQEIHDTFCIPGYKP